MNGRLVVRLALALAVLLGGAVAVAGALGTETGSAARAADLEAGERVAPPSGGTTVIATDSNTWLGKESDGPRAKAELFAVGPDGELRYYNDSHTRYWDVDPVPGTEATVEYVYADHLNATECGGESVCTRNGVERLNLTTGEVTRLFSRVTPGKHSTRWHDADRLDESRLVVADIGRDRVFVVNTTTEIVEWSWSAQSEFPVASSGGPFPEDWTHLNDVEVLDDGRIMASLRNHDQVVFLDRETGLVENWTLGSDGSHGIIYEQHNPDYIPESNGGPSVLVADSENDRVVEYHRTDGGEASNASRTSSDSSDGRWERTWTWRDGELAWPRDADRLPNGNTLVTDSNGNRVLEVAENGSVVWEMDVAFPYEAERLDTGDESTGGPARSGTAGDQDEDAATNENETVTPAGEAGGDDGLLASVVPGPLVNAVRYVLPVWMGGLELGGLLVASLAALVWVALEWRWSSLGITVRSPVGLERRR